MEGDEKVTLKRDIFQLGVMRYEILSSKDFNNRERAADPGHTSETPWGLEKCLAAHNLDILLAPTTCSSGLQLLRC